MNLTKIAAALIATSAVAFAAVTSAQTMKSDAMAGVLQNVKLTSVGAPTTGTLEIIQNTDGTRTLKLQNLKTEAGPDLHVYLYATAVPNKDNKDIKSVKYVDLGKLAAPFKGNYSYKIASNVKLTDFKSVIIWCDVAKVTFAGANLK